MEGIQTQKQNGKEHTISLKTKDISTRPVQQGFKITGQELKNILVFEYDRKLSGCTTNTNNSMNDNKLNKYKMC